MQFFVFIDGHLPIARRVPYKRVYPRSKAGDTINASIPMHEEGCMPHAAGLSVWNLLEGTAKLPQSVTKNSPNDIFRVAFHWKCFVAERCLPRPMRRRG